MSTEQLHVGQRVRYTPRQGDPVDGRIAGKDKKDGLAIFDVDVPGRYGQTERRWGYREQFEPLPGDTPSDIIGQPLLAALRDAGFKVVKR